MKDEDADVSMDLIKKRFGELSKKADAIQSSMSVEKKRETVNRDDYYIRTQRTPITKEWDVFHIDASLANEWQISVLAFLHRVFGKEDPTYLAFEKFSNARISNPQSRFKKLLSIFASAKEQFEGGYLFDVQNLVSREVFDDEFQQAQYFLGRGHEVAAAVTAGVILETAIKSICGQQVPPVNLLKETGKPKTTNTLIGQLKTAGAYDESVSKQLMSWMDKRNDAAHGEKKDGEFEEGAIGRMIEGIRDFVAENMN